MLSALPDQSVSRIKGSLLKRRRNGARSFLIPKERVIAASICDRIVSWVMSFKLRKSCCAIS